MPTADQPPEPAESPAITQLAVVAKAAGVSKSDVEQALATITEQGFAVNAAATALKQVIAELLAPSPALKQALSINGIWRGKATLEQHGLNGVLTFLVDYGQDRDIPFSRMFNTVEASAGASALTGQRASDPPHTETTSEPAVVTERGAAADLDDVKADPTALPPECQSNPDYPRVRAIHLLLCEVLDTHEQIAVEQSALSVRLANLAHILQVERAKELAAADTRLLEELTQTHDRVVGYCTAYHQHVEESLRLGRLLGNEAGQLSRWSQALLPESVRAEVNDPPHADAPPDSDPEGVWR